MESKKIDMTKLEDAMARLSAYTERAQHVSDNATNYADSIDPKTAEVWMLRVGFASLKVDLDIIGDYMCKIERTLAEVLPLVDFIIQEEWTRRKGAKE